MSRRLLIVTYPYPPVPSVGGNRWLAMTKYLRRAGHDVAAPEDAPGPWALSLAGHGRRAAAAWRALGDQYEQAVELVWSGDDQARAAGLGILKHLGAHATLSRAG